MTTQMMKAQPKFETCLFGPSGTPIPVKAYDYETTEVINIVSDNNFNKDGEKVIITTDKDEDSNNNDSVNENNQSMSNGDDHDDGANDNAATSATSATATTATTATEMTNSDDANAAQNPSPQTPTKPNNPGKIPTPPSRPAKVITKTPTQQQDNRSSTKQSTNTSHMKRSTSSSQQQQQQQPPPPIPSTKKKTQQNNHTINLQELRRLSSQGVPDDCSYRPVAWRILLGYLPLDTSKWQTVLDRDRLLYRTLVKELFVYSDDHDYPFESEGRQLIGRGLNRDGKKGEDVGKDNDDEFKANKLRNRYGERRNGDNASSDSYENKEEDANNNEIQIQDDTINEEFEVVKETKDDQEKEDNANDEEVTVDEDLNLSTSESTINQEDIPYEVKEQWRKSGRDPDSLLAGMGKTISGRFVNALLITNNDTATTKSNDMDRNLYLTKSLEGDYDPKWRHFLENASLLDEIRKDVVRTHPDLKFYLEPSDNLGSRRYAAIERILFVWAKLNKGVRYVQGMNEIVGTLYFVLANDENEEWASEAEADTYFLFNTLMVEMRDIFVPDLDEADTGIQGRMANMISLLSLHDPEVRCHLDDCHIDPGFYSIRWLTTLLSREFLLPDTIRLWDSMFASTHKDNFMRYVCVCMVMVIREDLLRGDFGTCLRLLQSYPPTNVDQLLESSRALWIYESQVTLACHKGGISLTQALSTIAPPPAVLMAYGLQGGLAPDTRKEMQQLGERRLRANGRTRRKNRSPTNSSNVTAAGAAKSILGFLGLSPSSSS